MSRLFFVVPLLVSLSPAVAQTPQDIARQVWPLGSPPASNTAPAHEFARNQFLPSSIADQPTLSAARSSEEPHVMFSSSFTGADLARLRGDFTPSLLDPAVSGQRIARQAQR